MNADQTPIPYSSYPQHMLLNTPKTAQIVEPLSSEQQATPENKPKWGLLFGIGALAIGAAALIVAAVDALSSPQVSPQPKPLNPSPSLLPKDVWAEMTNQDLIALNMHIENDQTDIWNIYLDYKAEMELVIRKVLQEILGPDLEYIIAFQQGSLKVSIVARFKKEWNKMGKNTTKQIRSIKLNISTLCRKIDKAITDFIKKVKKSLSSPKTKTYVKATFKVLPKVLTILANIATILGVIDKDLEEPINKGLKAWTA